MAHRMLSNRGDAGKQHGWFLDGGSLARVRVRRGFGGALNRCKQSSARAVVCRVMQKYEIRIICGFFPDEKASGLDATERRRRCRGSLFRGGR